MKAPLWKMREQAKLGCYNQYKYQRRYLQILHSCEAGAMVIQVVHKMVLAVPATG